MSVLFVRLFLVLTLLFTAAVGLVRAQPRDDRALRGFLEPEPDNCERPCWQGIRLGRTSVDSAEAILRQHPWVDSTRFAVRIESLVLTWSGAQPAFLPNDERGFVAVREGSSVEAVMLPTVIPFGDLVLTLGLPNRLYTFPNGSSIVAVYPTANLEITLDAACPLNTATLWSATTEIRWRFRDVPYAIFGGQPIDPLAFGWLKLLSRCER